MPVRRAISPMCGVRISGPSWLRRLSKSPCRQFSASASSTIGFPRVPRRWSTISRVRSPAPMPGPQQMASAQSKYSSMASAASSAVSKVASIASGRSVCRISRFSRTVRIRTMPQPVWSAPEALKQDAPAILTEPAITSTLPNVPLLPSAGLAGRMRARSFFSSAKIPLSPSQGSVSSTTPISAGITVPAYPQPG